MDAFLSPGGGGGPNIEAMLPCRVWSACGFRVGVATFASGARTGVCTGVCPRNLDGEGERRPGTMEDAVARACGRRFPFTCPLSPVLADARDVADVVEVVRARGRAVPLTFARTTSRGVVLAVEVWVASGDVSLAVTCSRPERV